MHTIIFLYSPWNNCKKCQMSTDMRHSLSLQVRYSFCIANVQTLHKMTLFSPPGILKDLVENFGPLSTFQEFSSWIHPCQKIFQETFACFLQHLKKEKNCLIFLYYRSHSLVTMQGYMPCTHQHGKSSQEFVRILKKNFQG